MSPLPIDLVLNPVDASWEQVLAIAHAAADRGYHGLWMLDHVTGAPFGSPTTSECFTLLGALGAAGPSLPLGALVANAASRPVAVTALAFETLHRVVGDRLRIAVGAGAGGSGQFAVEHEVLGSLPGTMAERHRRVGALVAAVRATPSLADLPIVVGANSIELCSLAGRLADGVNVGVHHPRRSELIAAALASADDGFRVSAWARWEPELLDVSSPIRRSLAADGVGRLMVAVRPAEISAGTLVGPGD